MKDRGRKHTYDLRLKDIRLYFRIHRYGLLLNGRLSTGLERMIMKLLDLQNVRETSTFLRDVHRLEA